MIAESVIACFPHSLPGMAQDGHSDLAGAGGRGQFRQRRLRQGALPGACPPSHPAHKITWRPRRLAAKAPGGPGHLADRTPGGGGAADNAESLTGCKSLYRQLPVFGRLAYPERAEATKHGVPGCKSPSCPAVGVAAVGTIRGASKLGGRNI